MTKFLVSALIKAGTQEDVIAGLSQSEWVTLEAVHVLKVSGRRVLSELCLPCPRDISFTRLEIVEDEGGAVYFGRCKHGHQLMLSAVRSSSKF